MIDKTITSLQESIVQASNKFVYRNTGPYSGTTGTIALGGIENRIVMSLSVAITSLMDYVKIPLALIEELAKGILLTPTIPFSSSLRRNCYNHYKHALHYTITIFSKLILGTIHDLYTLKVGFLSPHYIPYFVPPSYYGSQAIYNKSIQTELEKNHPSIYLA